MNVIKKYINGDSPLWTKEMVIALLVLFIIYSALGIVIGTISSPDGEESTEETSESITESDEFLTEKEEVSVVIEETTCEMSEIIVTEAVEPDVKYYDVPLSHDLQDYISELCDENGIPMSLVIAIIDVESSFNANAVSSTNDYGLMQINKCNHEWLRKQGVMDVFNPYQNVRGGIMILSECYNGNLSKSLMSYNLGVARANALWNEGVYGTSYSRAVLSAKEVYDEQI